MTSFWTKKVWLIIRTSPCYSRWDAWKHVFYPERSRSNLNSCEFRPRDQKVEWQAKVNMRISRCVLTSWPQWHHPRRPFRMKLGAQKRIDHHKWPEIWYRHGVLGWLIMKLQPFRHKLSPAYVKSPFWLDMLLRKRWQVTRNCGRGYEISREGVKIILNEGTESFVAICRFLRELFTKKQGVSPSLQVRGSILNRMCCYGILIE